MGDLLKYTAITAAGLAICLGLWLASLLWHSPDYAAIGTCSVAEIDQTATEIEAHHEGDALAGYRALYEFWHYHPHLETIEGDVVRSVNTLAFRLFGRRQTAVFICNHAERHVDGQAAMTVPELVKRLAPYEADETVRWRLALCLTSKARNIGGAYGPSFAQVRTMCRKWLA